MAASSKSMTTIDLMPVFKKLVRVKHTLWKAHVLAVLRGAQLAGIFDGTNLAPTEKIELKTWKIRLRKAQTLPLK
jgi:hypothetical protein